MVDTFLWLQPRNVGSSDALHGYHVSIVARIALATVDPADGEIMLLLTVADHGKAESGFRDSGWACPWEFVANTAGRLMLLRIIASSLSILAVESYPDTGTCNAIVLSVCRVTDADDSLTVFRDLVILRLAD